MRRVRQAGPLATALVTSGCGRPPAVVLFGSLFPVWLLCMAAGVATTVVARQVLARTGIEPHLGPLVIVYPSLVVLVSCVVWLIAGR